MRTALCLGGSDALFDDLARLHLPFDVVVACNEAGREWPGRLDAWVTLHPEKLAGWRDERAANGFSPACIHVGQRQHASVDAVREYRLNGVRSSGSSGMFTVKYALEDMGCERAVLCGIGLTATPHFYDRKAWGSSKTFQKAWLQAPDDTLARIRSMSGWTAVLCGGPGDWLHDLEKSHKPGHQARRSQAASGSEQRITAILA